VKEIDLRIGASFTRFQTMLLRDAFVIDVTGDDRNLVLSYGPCQVLYYTSKLFDAFSSNV
jgi:DNA topoisomerase III